jgi:effector-binding domain-containing protein
MPYRVELQTVTGTPILMVRRRASLQELPRVVPEACGVVWDFIRRSSIRSHGRNVAVYLNAQIDLEVGVEVGDDATAAGHVALSTTPTGRVATTTHLGPYDRLHHAHTAIRQWCATHQHRLAGPNWEVYGHWSDDPAKLRTEVFYLLATKGPLAG